MALLFGNISAVNRRLWNQLVLPKRGWDLRNLFLRSKLTWMQNNTPCKLIQQTNYPATNTTELHLEMARPETFTIYLRVPGWTNANTRISVNGKRVQDEIV